MTNEMIQYIAQCRAKGVTDAEIKQRLSASGWATEVIDQALALPSAPINSDPSSIATASSTNQNNRALYISPYSQMLAVALGLALLILSNGILGDIKQSVVDPNVQLVYQGLFAIPLLIIGSALYSSFSDKNRYKVLSLPYFAISAYVVGSLLWRVAAYVLDKNAATGVYIVLGMVIVVLTAIILFGQKIIKSN